jgi:hypothetical protein
MSETKTAKVEDVIQIRKWESPDKSRVMFYHVIALDNGDKGSVGKQTEGAIKVGDSLTYTIDGDKIKEVRQNGFGGGGFRGGRSQGSPASFALSYAKDLAVANIGKSDKPLEMDGLADKVIATAVKFHTFLKERE